MSEILFIMVLATWSVYALLVNLHRKDFGNFAYWTIAILACIARLCYMM